MALDFDGYGIGGLSVGEPRAEMLAALAATVPHLPADRPRYLMGVGDPVGMLESVALGVDQFDCVAPTRAARHGSLWTSTGRLNLRNAVHARDDAPIDPACRCRDLRPVVAWLPAAPPRGGRAHGVAPAHHPQPVLRARPPGRSPVRHRRRHAHRAPDPHGGDLGDVTRRLPPGSGGGAGARVAWATVEGL